MIDYIRGLDRQAYINGLMRCLSLLKYIIGIWVFLLVTQNASAQIPSQATLETNSSNNAPGEKSMERSVQALNHGKENSPYPEKDVNRRTL